MMRNFYVARYFESVSYVFFAICWEAGDILAYLEGGTSAFPLLSPTELYQGCASPGAFLRHKEKLG